MSPWGLAAIASAWARLASAIAFHAAFRDGLELKTILLELLFLQRCELQQRLQGGKIVGRRCRARTAHDEHGSRRSIFDRHPHRRVSAGEQPTSRLHMRSSGIHSRLPLALTCVGW